MLLETDKLQMFLVGLGKMISTIN